MGGGWHAATSSLVCVQASTRCSGGCSCEYKELDGFHKLRTSVVWVEHLLVTIAQPAESGGCACTLHLTALAPAARGAAKRAEAKGIAKGVSAEAASLDAELKFKLALLMLPHEGAMNWVDPWKTQWLAVGDSMQPGRRLQGRRGTAHSGALAHRGFALM